MVLLCPVACEVLFSEDAQDAVFELADLLSRKLLLAHCLLEDCLDLRVCIWFVVELLDTVV